MSIFPLASPLPVSATTLPLPTGAATSANQPVIAADGGAQVHVQNFPATQPVSLTTLPALASGSAAIGSVTVSNLPATQAVSGTITANAGSGTFAVQGVVNGAALIVSGGAAAGAPPVNPPISVSGVDGSGNKQHFLTDTAGRQVVSVQPASVSTMATASVTTTSAQVVAARAGRRRLSFQNTGAGMVTLLFGTGTATVGGGIVLASGGSANSQGGAWEEPGHECWAGAVQAIGAVASTLMIIEG